ncbi:MAG: acyl-CoA thioesterase [Bacteroidales bacterium]|nr:acyl-CoA thioesterase [Bacteroidales bacterium]
MLVFKDGKIVHEVQIRVTYKDTDKMGYSYYGNYPTYFEIARTEFLRELGLSYKKLEDDGFLLPIANMSIKYLKPAKYDDLLTVRTSYKKLHSVKVEFEYEIFNQNGEILNQASTLLVFVDVNSRKPIRAPEYYMNAMSRFFEQNKN